MSVAALRTMRARAGDRQRLALASFLSFFAAMVAG
jgi:hypothetical protein